MARPLRIEYDGALYHVTSRGNERKAIFKNDSDRTLFLDTLTQLTSVVTGSVMPNCLMNNHYPLVIETPDGNLSKGMRQLNGVYTQAYNQRHGLWVISPREGSKEFSFRRIAIYQRSADTSY
jgi:putative transposase